MTDTVFYHSSLKAATGEPGGGLFYERTNNMDLEPCKYCGYKSYTFIDPQGHENFVANHKEGCPMEGYIITDELITDG